MDMIPGAIEEVPSPRRAITICALACSLAVLCAAGAAAHEGRPIGPNQEFRMVVGWRLEPAYAGVHNAVDIHLNRADGTAVNTGEGDTVDLKVEIQLREADAVDAPVAESALLAESPRLVPLATNRYNAWVTPTRPGVYAFRIRGTIDDAQDEAGPITVDETFVCGVGGEAGTGFHCVAAPQTFPPAQAGGTPR